MFVNTGVSFFYFRNKNITYNRIYKEVIFMTYKQIETMREVRLWIGQIVVPIAGVAATVLAACPEARQTVSNKLDEMKTNFRRKRTGGS